MVRSLVKVALGMVCLVWLSGCGLFGEEGGWGTQKDPAPGVQTPHGGAAPAPLPVMSGSGR